MLEKKDKSLSVEFIIVLIFVNEVSSLKLELTSNEFFSKIFLISL